ncbi:cysteine hydrolase [Candidatus Marsarchaeota archaeon]|jgi:nicotinamidase-related amidase|nr:cysteine hydrolase [Candidatus Marsarchaeota archaeon]MCL5092752.1 cysteine hydrolase [Candidatus Marsarchaeota archaeon]
MEVENNKKIYSSIEDILDRRHSALVVWDVQNMLLDRIFNKDEFKGKLNAAVSAARKSDVPVFFTKITPLPDRYESRVRLSSARRWNMSKIPAEAFELAIVPEKNDVVLNKNTASIFIGTNFEMMVRNAGIESLVFTGIATEIGVESSARDALNRGFFPVVAQDAVSSADKDAHERSLANMKNMLSVISVEELLKVWK